MSNDRESGWLDRLLACIGLVKRSRFALVKQHRAVVIGERNALRDQQGGCRRDLAKEKAAHQATKDQSRALISNLRDQVDGLETNTLVQREQNKLHEKTIFELNRLATTDPLTGLANRRGLHAFADGAINLISHQLKASGERRQPTVCAIVFDLDRFKLVNDMLDHQAGDNILCIVAQHATQHFPRPSDIVTRLGGDEFVVLMPNADQSVVQRKAERFRASLEGDIRLRFIENEPGVTASIGISRIFISWDSKPQEVLQDLLRKADRALLVAKQNGRNTICLSEDITRWGGLNEE
ncbi:MAG: GGDEF domain-containing protein [Candidatus Moranbacteria bacterium]|nr:GGDEF domain-containing protein [Candidatus Moranbacteria bacterium]